MCESVTVSRVELARRFELAVSLVGYAISIRFRVSTEREHHVAPSHKYTIEITVRKRDTEIRYGKA
uniref:Uncharacterized protein n=1 Tax=Oryza barthii TaxID=65489 RepID=A0A0D3EN32_9ORYZ